MCECLCVRPHTRPFALTQVMFIPPLRIVLERGGEWGAPWPRDGVPTSPPPPPGASHSELGQSRLLAWVGPARTALGTLSTRSHAPSAGICDPSRAERARWLRLSPKHCLNVPRPCRGCSQYQPPPSRKLLDTAIRSRVLQLALHFTKHTRFC